MAKKGGQGDITAIKSELLEGDDEKLSSCDRPLVHDRDNFLVVVALNLGKVNAPLAHCAVALLWQSLRDSPKTDSMAMRK